MRPRLRAVTIACAARIAGAAALSAPLVAQQDSPRAPKRAEAVRIADQSPRIDGVLDDPAWAQARWFSDFRQKEPVQGADPSEGTEVAFLYDGQALYVGARLSMRDPSQIRALVTRRDQEVNADRLIVSLDTYRDRRTAYSFALTAAGVRLDWYHPQDNEDNRDLSFDPVWVGRARVDADGWTAEMRIPFSQLRFAGRGEQIWGVNVVRILPSKNEEDFWVYVPRDETGWSSRFGTLEGIRDIAPSTRLELMPYLASAAVVTSDTLVDPRDPFHDVTEGEARVGVDVKMGLGPNLTMDVTVNPDFGQVEADPAEVNLTQFETFFRERRPFFIEGSQLLEGQGPGYYYSRRIGAPPRGPADGDFVDRPPTSTILGAAKLTGRLPSGLSVGVVAAVTEREYARTFTAVNGSFRDLEVAPLTGFGVVRLMQEFGSSASTVGLSLTGVRRDVAGGDPLGELLARQAYAGGMDWRLRLSGGAFEVRGWVGFSYVEGDSNAIARVQRSPARYFQRPDQDYVTFDPARTSLAGYVAGLSVFKLSGRHWLWGARTTLDSPGFEINDAGQLNTADELTAFAFLIYRNTEPGPVFRRYAIEVNGFSQWNFGGVREFTQGAMELSGQFRNFMSADLGFSARPRSRTDDATRGGPLFRVGSGWSTFGALSSNPNQTTQWRMHAFYFRSETGTWLYDLSGDLTIRPRGRWNVSVGPGYQRLREARQYLAALPGGPDATFGTRYVFGVINRSELSARLRLNYSVTPDLSLELYAEPFAASGRFLDIGELRAAGGNELLVYGTEGTSLSRDADGNYVVTVGGNAFGLPNLDFNVRSFRSNVVLRWEWRPGSTLFLVWQRSRFARDPEGSLVGPGDALRSFSAPGENFIAVKLSYWLPVT